MSLTSKKSSDGGIVFIVDNLEEVWLIQSFLLREYGSWREVEMWFPDGVMLKGPIDPRDFDVSKSEGERVYFSYWATRK